MHVNNVIKSTHKELSFQAMEGYSCAAPSRVRQSFVSHFLVVMDLKLLRNF